jgi:hypothetical protein
MKETSMNLTRTRRLQGLATVILFAWASSAEAKVLRYNLAAGTVSDPVTIHSNVPVHVVGVQTNVGFRGIGSADLLSIPGPGGFIEWVGLDSPAGAAITQGFSGFPGSKILYLDFSHCVILEVAGAAGSSQIAVHNTCAVPAAGSVTIK